MILNRLDQCFSTFFSLTPNPLQHFRLLTECWRPKGQNSRPRAGKGSLGRGGEPRPHQLQGLGKRFGGA